jgi:HD domain
VRDALACTFERWNGKGQPNRVKGERIPLACEPEPRHRLRGEKIARRLVIRPKTAGSHIQHIYAKIGCSARGTAVLFALRHNLAG